MAVNLERELQEGQMQFEDINTDNQIFFFLFLFVCFVSEGIVGQFKGVFEEKIRKRKI